MLKSSGPICHRGETGVERRDPVPLKAMDPPKRPAVASIAAASSGATQQLLLGLGGAVVSALVGDGDGPREIARATLIDVIDILAPIDLHTVRV